MMSHVDIFSCMSLSYEALDVIVIRSVLLCSTVSMHNPPAPKMTHTHTHTPTVIMQQRSTLYQLLLCFSIWRFIFKLTSAAKEKSFLFKDVFSFQSLQCTLKGFVLCFLCLSISIFSNLCWLLSTAQKDL